MTAETNAPRPLFGIGHRRSQHAALLEAADDARPSVLEVMPDHFFDDPDRLAPLAERYAIVLHDVGLSLGTRGALRDGLGRQRLARLREIAAIARPLLISDHLAVTRTASGTEVGHLLPVWRTRATLSVVVDNLRALADALGVPVAVENIATPFEIPGAQLSEAEMLREITEQSGARLLLDLSNLVANAHNFGFDAAMRLREYPLGAVGCVHLAGATHDGAWRVDSHDSGVDDASYAALTALAASATPDFVIVERDQRVPALAESLNELRHARDVWQRARGAP